ncbi:MAG: mandelate racemase/muconate lactonizing enzyme family protein [Actinomycetes bacterium]
MKIESVDMFYLAMPEVLDIGDGSQDMVLVRVRAGDWTGWGECEASPLPTIASLVTPMSHSACHPVLDSVLGQRLDTVADITRIADEVRARSLDLLQTDHALSGIEIALWDLLGKSVEQPVYELLGTWGTAAPVGKTPYASALFGDTPQETLEKARSAVSRGFHAVKFGWGPYGLTTVEADADQVRAAREGLGADGILLVDAGTVWGDNVGLGVSRLPALLDARALWLEEPFVSGALRSYADLATQSGSVRLAGGEGAHTRYMAEHMIDHGGVGFIQIDTGRVGGISTAHEVWKYAHDRGVQFVNHTFTSHLALSASLQPYAGAADDWICEYPVELKALARELTSTHIDVDADGTIRPPAKPGLGMELDLVAASKYLIDVDITVGGRTIYRTPELTS